MKMADVRQRLNKLKAEYESRYGIELSLREAAEIRQAEKEQSQCAACCGLPCRKGQNRVQIPEVIIENGRLYITGAECPYLIASGLEEKSVKAGVPRRYAEATFADYVETAANSTCLQKAKWYAAEKPDEWLYVYGGCGTGKTFLISILAKELIAAGLEVVFTDFQRILEELKSSFDDKAVTASSVLEKYETCEVLILDDVGTGYFRDWGVSVLHQIINARYNAALRTLITSNYDLAGLSARLSSQEEYGAARIISRLKEECEVVYMEEDDWRG